MGFSFLKTYTMERKILSWAYVGLLVFVSAFLWAPSRDGLQGVYYLAFFLPMLMLLLLARKPRMAEYGGWMTLSALLYAGFAALSALWSNQPKDVGFFIFQWCVLAVWLCGSSLLWIKREFDLEKYLRWMVIVGVLVIVATVANYYHGFFIRKTYPDMRLLGWNVFRNANEIGAMSGIIAIIAFTLGLQAIQSSRRYGFYALAALAGIGLIASFSRGAMVAFALMAIAALLAVRPPLKVWLPPVALGLLLLLGLVVSGVVSGYLGREAGGSGRSILWWTLLDRSREQVFTGIGMSKITTIFIPDVEVYNHAHNAWLDTFYRTGLIGLILILLHLQSLLTHLHRRSPLLPLYLWLGFGCVCSLFDSRCFFGEIGAKWFFYWIPAGLITASLTGMAFRAERTRLEREYESKE